MLATAPWFATNTREFVLSIVTPTGFDPIDGWVFKCFSDPSSRLIAKAATPPPAPGLPPSDVVWLTAYKKRPSADVHMPSQFRSSTSGPVLLTSVSDPSLVFTLNTVTPPPPGAAAPPRPPPGPPAPGAPPPPGNPPLVRLPT